MLLADHAVLLSRILQARALTALRQRKYQEQLLSRTDIQLSTLQGLVRRLVFSSHLGSRLTHRTLGHLNRVFARRKVGLRGPKAGQQRA